MRRGLFLTALLGSAVALQRGSRAAVAATLAVLTPIELANLPPVRPDVDLPADFLGGRPFLRLTTALGSRVLVWLDTDGSGFISESLVRRENLTTHGRRAAVPLFREEVPPPGGDGLLPILSASDVDPITAAVDIQFGGTWFAQRVWTIDYRNQKIVWHGDGRAAATDSINQVALKFTDERKLYPVVPVIVDGEPIPMALDTAASLLRRPGDVTATSFISRARFAQWHAAHPDWPVRRFATGVDGIDIPEVRVGNVGLGGVTFTTRPNDDVFEGESVTGKLGSNAWVARQVILDYLHATAAFD